MQYIAKCLHCGDGLRAPTVNQAERWRNDHIENTSHVVRLTGLYDSRDLSLLRGPDGEIPTGYRAIRREMGAWAQHPDMELYGEEWQNKLDNLVEEAL